MWEKIKKAFQFFANPKLLLCFGLAWMVTNGWAYILLGIGTYWGITWMTAVSGAYLALIWLPISPEKILTVAISVALLRFLFPNDEKTVGEIRKMKEKMKEKLKKGKKK